MNKKRIILNSRDFARLKKVVNDARSNGGNQYIKNLDSELSDALLLEPEKIPPDVITMNTKVQFTDVEESEEFVYTIVYPEEADLEQGRLSILAPIGTALIGYRVGDEVAWEVPAGIKKFRIEKIIYQPEANGDFHL